MLAQHLQTTEQLEKTIAAFDARIEEKLVPFRDTVERLKEVPGLGSTVTEFVIAEIGLDMSLFPSAGHLLSWAGFVPRLDESAGKSRSTRIRKGARGSSLCWSKPHGEQHARRTATSRLSFSGLKRGMVQKKPPSRSPRQS